MQRIAANRIPGLDGLRAIAILSVIICHVNITFSNLFPSSRVNHFITILSSAGWVGVDLFFVLSGFLITGILYHAKESENYYINFYIRRALRIFPLFYAYTTAILVFLPVLFSGTSNRALSFWLGGNWLDRVSVFAYFYNFRAAFIGHHLPLVNHFWSLAVEEHFYFVWPFVVLHFGRSALMRMCIAGCSVSLLLRLALMNSQHGLFAAYLVTPCRVDGLLLGAWLALASLDGATWARVGRFAPYVAVVAAAGILAIAIDRGHFYDVIPPGAPNDSRPIVTAGISLVSILFAATLAIVVRGGRLTRWLEFPVLRRIGLYSYGMYVYHECLIILAGQTGLLAGLSEARSKVILSAVTTAVTFAVAAASYHGFERPFLKLKSRFEVRRFEQVAGLRANEVIPVSTEQGSHHLPSTSRSISPEIS
jgi:peptidoglycan/LPS O-acetylase OafA/YrhL